jgi:hypothetical protein
MSPEAADSHQLMKIEAAEVSWKRSGFAEPPTRILNSDMGGISECHCPITR